jgi:hypothetical protein
LPLLLSLLAALLMPLLLLLACCHLPCTALAAAARLAGSLPLRNC